MSQITEFNQLITADGIVYDLDVHSRQGRWVIGQGGWGLPPIQYVTSREPLGGAEEVRTFRLRPRTIQLFIRHEFCSRDEYWTGRSGLLEVLRFNRGTGLGDAVPATLRRRLPDGALRDLAVYVSRGAAFTPRGTRRWDEWAYQEALRFTAYDPVIFDPTQRTETFVLTTLTELVFPITFPITFGSATIDETRDVTYVGTWDELPTIILTGPLNNPIITNTTTGEVIELTFNIPDGRVVTIDLSYGVKTVTDDLNTNLIGTVTPASDLGTWHLAPAPEAALGVNVIRVQGSQALAGTTQVALTYFDRYIGI